MKAGVEGRGRIDTASRFNDFVFCYLFWDRIYFKYVTKKNMVDGDLLPIHYRHCN